MKRKADITSLEMCQACIQYLNYAEYNNDENQNERMKKGENELYDIFDNVCLGDIQIQERECSCYPCACCGDKDLGDRTEMLGIKFKGSTQ